jgi:hypothetical protein
MRRLALCSALALGALVGPVAGAAGAGGVAPPFTIDPFSAEAEPGGSVAVSGSGCPPAGAFAEATGVVLYLTPPSGGNAFGANAQDGELVIVSTAAYVAGESSTSAVPDADGTFDAVLAVPLDAPDGAYTVRGLCTTLLEPDDSPNGVSPASVERASTEQGTLQVTAPPATPGEHPIAPAPPARTSPRFTG